MAVSKVVLAALMLAVFVSTVAAQFGGLGSFGGLGFGFGGKPFGKPGFGGFGGKPGFGGLGGKPGKPGYGLLLGGLGDLYRFQGPEDASIPYYNWQNVPSHN